MLKGLAIGMCIMTSRKHIVDILIPITTSHKHIVDILIPITTSHNCNIDIWNYNCDYPKLYLWIVKKKL